MRVTVADPGFPKWGGKPREGVLIYYLAKNLQKSHEHGINWTEKGARIPHTMSRSTTWWGVELQNIHNSIQAHPISDSIVKMNWIYCIKYFFNARNNGNRVEQHSRSHVN